MNQLLWNIELVFYCIWNLLLLSPTVAALWKFVEDWSKYPEFYRWFNFVLPIFLLFIILLGVTGSLLKNVKYLIMRILIIIDAILYWFAFDPLNQVKTIFEYYMRLAWKEQMNGYPKEFNNIENFLQCCGVAGCYDYVIANMTIPKSCGIVDFQYTNGCLLASAKKFKNELYDFYSWDQWLWFFIGIDVCLSLVLILTDILFNIQEKKFLYTAQRKSNAADIPVTPFTERSSSFSFTQV